MCRPEGQKESNWVVYRRVQSELQASSPRSPIITPPEKKPKERKGMYRYIPASTSVRGETLPSYNTNAAPARNANDIKPVDSSVARDGCHGCIPLDASANVVANCAVGFGPPLIVTVGLDGTGLTVALPEATMENFCELAYMPPWVLFRNRRK